PAFPPAGKREMRCGVPTRPLALDGNSPASRGQGCCAHPMTIQRTRGSLYPTCTALLLVLVMALLAPGGAPAQDPFSDNPFSDNPFADPPAGAPAEGEPAPSGTDGLPTPTAPAAKVLTAEEQLE